MDLVSENQAGEVEAVLAALNPGARIVPAVRGEVELSSVLDTGLFDYEKAESSAGWIRELQEDHQPETEEYGISSFTYRTPQPFDAEVFWEFINDEDVWRGVLRSKGFFWVAADDHVAYELAQAGGVNSVTPAGTWWAAVPKQDWGHPEGERPDDQPNWDERFGDRAQSLVFIGQELDEAKLRARLDGCLLETQVQAKPHEWCALPNPFPRPQILDEAMEGEQ